MTRRTIPAALAALSLVLLAGCSFLRTLMEAKIQEPNVEFTGARLADLAFDKVDLLFDLKVENPNDIGLKLAGLDYEFFVNNASFARGDLDRSADIPAKGDVTVQFPLTVVYDSLYSAIRSLGGQDTSTYRIECGLSFAIPVLGSVRIPIRKEGNLPLLKRPEIRVEDFNIKRLTLTGADMGLRLKVKNPNAFSFLLERLQYRLNVNGRPWASGDGAQTAQIAEKGEGMLEIPISLNFRQIGPAVYQMLARGESLNYDLQGGLDLKSSIPLLERFHLPLNLKGEMTP